MKPMGECHGDQSRVDASGRAHAGSQRQIQIYVNDLPDALNRAIAESLSANLPPSVRIQWVSPLKHEGYTEYYDDDFLRALGIQQHESELLAFWPKRGPCWDALARVLFSDGHCGCVLVEAKSHVNEIYGNGCCASDASTQQICEALRRAKEWLAVAPEADWTGKLYQSANRYAHLYFLRVVAKIDAFLVNVYFVNDRSHRSQRPTTIQKWKPAIGEVKHQLGLVRPVPFSSEVFLDAVPS
ncbi:MAG: hypothetical protein HY233_07530 [Acidobacteriales bacterium]|nr:hypothetical protein [Candidatus Koribacter versatilis]MBI3645797.1 hypothetical protein [Terriglobales bacterium]